LKISRWREGVHESFTSDRRFQDLPLVKTGDESYGRCMNEDPREFRRRRIEAGLSQTDLALKAGVSKSHLSDVENGRAGFSPRNLKAIADILGCTIRDLLLPEDDKTGTPAVRSVA